MDARLLKEIHRRMEFPSEEKSPSRFSQESRERSITGQIRKLKTEPSKILINETISLLCKSRCLPSGSEYLSSPRLFISFFQVFNSG